MEKLHNPALISRAKKLRKNMTEEERKLWYTFLNRLPLHFSRQKVLKNYIVDFYCAQAKLIIELDGSQHYEDKGLEHDKIRDETLSQAGFKILRYSNLEVNQNFDKVCADIYRNLNLE